jgi:hypothetical protein
MHFKPFAPMKGTGSALIGLASIIDRRMLRKRANALTQRIDTNPALGHFLRQEYAIELAIDRLFQRRKTTGRWPKKIGDETTAEALSFAFSLTEVHRRLSSKAQTALKQACMEA